MPKLALSHPESQYGTQSHSQTFLEPAEQLFQHLSLSFHLIAPYFDSAIMSPYSIRPVLTTDLPSIVRIDAATQPNEPIVKIPWVKPEDFFAAGQDRYEWMLRRGDYKGLVACDEEKVVGFLIWRRPKKEGEELKEWVPNLPEGTNLRFLGTYLLGY
jgi:hypothetical protein